jgi:hypothetical protein
VRLKMRLLIILNPDNALEMRKRFRNCKSDFYKSDNIF